MTGEVGKAKGPNFGLPIKIIDTLTPQNIPSGACDFTIASYILAKRGTIMNWERNRSEPKIQYLPKIIDFLGYAPFSPGESFPERFKAYRMLKGLTQRQLAREPGVDTTTAMKWERGRAS